MGEGGWFRISGFVGFDGGWVKGGFICLGWFIWFGSFVWVAGFVRLAFIGCVGIWCGEFFEFGWFGEEAGFCGVFSEEGLQIGCRGGYDEVVVGFLEDFMFEQVGVLFEHFLELVGIGGAEFEGRLKLVDYDEGVDGNHVHFDVVADVGFGADGK